jgi:starvation-inducible outer membrane lipoprotein
MKMMRVAFVAAGVTAAFALAGCGEKPQGIGGVKSDTAPYTGTVDKQAKAYADKNWKAGDQKSWESQMRARTQNGQNEYVKAPS